jgi:hypothetical protein
MRVGGSLLAVYKLLADGIPKDLQVVKNGVFWDVKLFGCCKNRRFGGT